MSWFEWIVGRLEYYVWNFGIPVAGEMIPIIVIALLGTGVFLTLRLGFIQLRRLAHGFGVTSGKYDDPAEPGDVSHFQALTTALSATVGIGNIAGVAIAIHFGGPGALFWMWITALLGMAVKYSEVVLAQEYRVVEKTDLDPKKWEGSVSGGPMYYIERGLGPKWKPMAVFFALALMATSFLTGNAVQANTVADTVQTEFGLATWITGAITAAIVAAVIIGGISRIGAVTGVLAPVMAGIYVIGALTILAMNPGQILPAFGTIFSEAFNPTAGVAGTGVGAFLVTMMWGVRRGLFSNEAGQGSAPIAHSAAKTDEPVSEGVVALLEPFIDTILICSMTGLVIIVTGVWNDTIPTTIELRGGDLSYVEQFDDGSFRSTTPSGEIRYENGQPAGGPVLAWHEVGIEQLWADEARSVPFTGTIDYQRGVAVTPRGEELDRLYGDAVESGAPLTKLAFERGLAPLGNWGGMIVVISVLLFAISTAISWSYYGDRCANYVFGKVAILPFKFVFVGMHFIGATVTLATVWTLGDIALGFVTFPNLIALVLLSGVVVRLTKSYFERKPWIENAEVHKRIAEEKRQRRH
ncbi:MAG: sodium:alanine symporter family protein [Acidobacteria bacterium]|nr:sodium:alanine symporter family protein [Acidobacteriota bacterium]